MTGVMSSLLLSRRLGWRERSLRPNFCDPALRSARICFCSLLETLKVGVVVSRVVEWKLRWKLGGWVNKRQHHTACWWQVLV